MANGSYSAGLFTNFGASSAVLSGFVPLGVDVAMPLDHARWACFFVPNPYRRAATTSSPGYVLL
jgi:hypothetical protein